MPLLQRRIPTWLYRIFRNLTWPTRKLICALLLLFAICYATWICVLTTSQPSSERYKRSRHSTASSTKHVFTVKEILNFPPNYHSKGVLSLPYGDIVEPFEAWYSGEHKMSRIDYYGGMDRTYQRENIGKHGFACKVVPEFSENTQKTFRGCLHRRGTKRFPVKAQSIVPTSHYFKYIGDVTLRGQRSAKWEHKFTIYNKVNTYILYTTKNRNVKPLRYEMMGYDTLLSSYYDHYVLDYELFEPWKFDYSTFQIPTDLDCFDFTRKKFSHIAGELNPMLEFMPHTDNGAPFTFSHGSNGADDSSKPVESHRGDDRPSESTSYPSEGVDTTSLDDDEVSSEGLAKNEQGATGRRANKNTEKSLRNSKATRRAKSGRGRTLHPWSFTVKRTHDVHFSRKHNSRIRHSSKKKRRRRKYRPSDKAEGKSERFSTDSTSLRKNYEDIVNLLFDAFKVDHKKIYSSYNEHETRKDIYRHNLRFIMSRNRMHLGYKLRPNHLMDMTDSEIQKRKGLLEEDDDAFNGGSPFKPMSHNVPKFVDWRKRGAVNSVRSQGICGSCYAYAVTGALEGAYFLKNGYLPDFSEQEIIDCSWGFGNRGCKGGYPYRAMQWILKHGGLATDDSYGKYLAQEGYCHFQNVSIGVIVESYMNISKGNMTELKQAVAQYGPVSVLISTQPKSFKFYSSGVYYDPECGKNLDHAALAVGYGVQNGTPYWLIKNSWSRAWGAAGYIKIAQRENNCGVTSKAVVVKLK